MSLRSSILASVAAVTLLSIFFSGCSSTNDDIDLPPERISLETPTETVRPPWELWSYGLSLNGESIEHKAIRAGDAELKKDNYVKGLRAYEQARKQKLEPTLREALAVREGSVYLKLGTPQKALTVISDYYQSIGEQAVHPYAGLVLAYAYGATGDIDQSLAWFLQVSKTESDSPLLSIVAERGARLLVAAIPPSQFTAKQRIWDHEPSIAALFSAEDRLRTSNQERILELQPIKTFWHSNLPENEEVSVSEEARAAPAKINIGFLLPLSGEFSFLGQNLKNGIEAAFETEKEKRITPVFKDSGGDVDTALVAFQQLVDTDKADIVVGPLLSEPARAVAPKAQSQDVLLISLSKANNFETGGKIFRLGATTNGQADSLLEKCAEDLNMHRYALVYPENQVGLEYAQSFKKYINAKGLELVYEATYTSGDAVKLERVAAEIGTLDVEGIFFPDSIAAAQSFFALFPEAVRKKFRPLGAVLWDNPTEIARNGGIFDGAVYVTPYFMQSEKTLSKQFAQYFQDKFKKKPDFLAAQGYDAAILAIAASKGVLAEGGDLDLALKNSKPYDGLTGEMRVDVSGEIFRNYVVLEYAGGKLKEVERSLSSSTEAPPTQEGEIITENTHVD